MSALGKAIWLVLLGPLVLVIPPLRRQFFKRGQSATEAR